MKGLYIHCREYRINFLNTIAYIFAIHMCKNKKSNDTFLLISLSNKFALSSFFSSNFFIDQTRSLISPL